MHVYGRGRNDAVPWKTGDAACVFWTRVLQRVSLEFISLPSPPLPALHQQPWNIKADQLQFQSCDFSAAELVMRKIISKLNVQCFSQIMFKNIEL